MSHDWLSRFSAVICLVLLWSVRAVAQDACYVPPGLSRPVAGNIFDEEQENWLGDAIADWIEHRETLVKDPSENAYLQSIGDRLLAALPPSKLKFRFQLIDSGEINGFSLAGGRVYLTRKLVATAKSEDEVAGVVAHEIGHIVTHQSAAEISAQMKRLLGVTKVGDRADILDKFTKMIDLPDPNSKPVDSDANQAIADSVAVYAMAKAGYVASAYPDFWDRSFFVQGKTGSGWTDFFGVTRPDQKRLRSLRTMVQTLPLGCGSKSVKSDAEFKKWQLAVTANQRGSSTADISEAMKVVTLAPALRADLQKIRYSPNGKYFFAQDEGSIFVLDAATGKFQFRFDSDDAQPAEWSPDSSRIVFHTKGLHLEEWDIAQRKLRSAREIVSKHNCSQTLLSPDGRTLLCIAVGEYQELTERLPLELYLLDTETGSDVFQKRDFSYARSLFAMLLYSLHLNDDNSPLMYTALSQDGNTLVVGDFSNKIAFDLKTRTEIRLAGDFKSDVTGPFAFQGNGIVGANEENPKKSGLFSFPEGKRMLPAPINNVPLSSISKGDFVRAFDGESTALFNLATQRVLLRSSTTALDISGSNLAIQNPNGGIDVGTIDATTGKATLQSHEALPPTQLPRLQVSELSPDGKYLAISGRTRGGVWDIETGKQLYLLRRFNGVAFHKDGALYLDFPKYQKSPREIAKASLGENQVVKTDVEVSKDTYDVAQRLADWKSTEKNKLSLTVRDVATGSALWSHNFEGETPSYRENLSDGNLLLIWQLDSRGARAELKSNPAAALQASAIKDKSKGAFLELFDVRDGKLKQSVAVELPHTYFGSVWPHLIGDSVLMETRDNRTIVYSAKTGAQTRQLFGYPIAADEEAGMICLRNRTDEATVYDKALTQIAHFRTNVPIRFAKFSKQTKQLLLLGADQKMRAFDLTAAAK